MSDDLRIAVVAEGPTDLVVIQAALGAFLPRPFVTTLLQPDTSLAFASRGTGWAGVYRWCEELVRDFGSLTRHSLLFAQFDLLVVHLDQDVAGLTYASANLTPRPSDGPLPCVRPCPPAADSVGALRAVLLTWLGERAVPAKTALCIPSTSTDSWVFAALFPKDRLAQDGVECLPDAEKHLARQPKKTRVAKSRREYEARRDDLTAAWPRLASKLSQAGRFEAEVVAALRS